MSGAEISVQLEERKILGKAVKGLRKDGMVPAVIHDHGKDSVIVMGSTVALLKAYQEAGKHHPLQLHVGKNDYMALIKDVDLDPKKQQLRHLVFNAIKQDEEVEAEIPIAFEEGVEIPAEKISLMVLQQLDHVEVKALPRDLPDVIFVNPSSLAEVGDRLTVADLKVPSGVSILTEPETQLAVVEMPKDQEAEANAAAAELAAEDAEKAEGGEEAAPTAEGGSATETKDTKDASEEE